MKKSFMFVAVAAAGMLASCSSDSLIAGSDPTIEPTPAQEELVPIEISVATPMARLAQTRGTGTVGGVEDGSDNAVNNDGSDTGTPKSNIWAGQNVNVYMFKTGTLDLAYFKAGDHTGIFENAEMVTPQATANTNEGRAHYIDPAGSGRYLEKYYPLTGVYDFWGYRIDDATAADDTPNPVPARNGSKYQVEIKVDGTQDVLGATTVPATWESLTDEQKNQFDGADDDAKKAAYNAYIAPGLNCKLYSASSARKKVQPRLVFNHMMTRLTFEAYPGNTSAKDVYVTGIKVRPIKTIAGSDTTYVTNTGTFDIAGTGVGFEGQKINWGTAAGPLTPPYNQYQFELMKRDETLGKDAYTALAAGSWYENNGHVGDNNYFITKAQYDALDAGSPGQDDYAAIADDKWYSLNSDDINKAKFIDATEYGYLPATTTLNDAVGNMDLVPLTDVSMNFDPAFDLQGKPTVKKSIGDAIIAPDAQYYELEIDLRQKVKKYEDSAAGIPDDWEAYEFGVVKTVVRAGDTPDPFEVGKSYDFVIKVYGLEKIEVYTVLKPWIFGEAIGVVTE